MRSTSGKIKVSITIGWEDVKPEYSAAWISKIVKNWESGKILTWIQDMGEVEEGHS
jgi:hypothetical protein